MSITRIIPEIRSNDVETTRNFYTNTLGLVVDMEEENFLMMSSPVNTSRNLSSMITALLVYHRALPLMSEP